MTSQQLLLNCLTFLFVIAPVVQSQDTKWFEQEVPTTGLAYVGIDFSTVDSGMVVAAEGALYSTIDGGETWNSNTSLPHYFYIHGIQNLDDSLWIVYGSSGIHRSANFGNMWTQILQDATIELPVISCSFVSVDTGYCVDFYGQLFRTVDSGLNWVRIPNDGVGSDVISKIDAHKGGYVLASGNVQPTTGITLFSTNAGEDWIRRQHFDCRIESCQLTSETLMLVVGFEFSEGGMILVSRDSGRQWERNNNFSQQSIIAAEIDADSFVGYAIGGGGEIWRTEDLAKSWNRDTTPTNATLLCIDIYRNHSASTAGYSVILRNENVTSVLPGAESLTRRTDVVMFPNPSEGVVCFRFTEPLEMGNSQLEIDVSDINGVMMRRVLLSKTAVQQSYSLDLSDLPNGMYCLQFDVVGNVYGTRICIGK